MKIVKFRAWDKEDEVMRSWEEIDFSKDIGDDYYMIGYKASPVLVKYDHKKILMQYTGLKDKNDVEIYEGDILYVDQQSRGTIDKFIPHKRSVAVRYEAKDTAYVFDEEYGQAIGLYTSPDEIEVIGNIYENPELLEEI